MVKCNATLIFSLCLMLSLVFECQLSFFRPIRCPSIRLDNGRIRMRSSGRIVRVSCFSPFKLVRGKETITCVDGEWDSEAPFCARTGCQIENVAHGQINVYDGGAKLEVVCDAGYILTGPKTVYCDSNFEWTEEIKGCKDDEIYLSCDFESSDERFCGWKNDLFNDVDWLADRSSFLVFNNRRHVTPGSTQYFTSNYISLDAGNFGFSTVGRLISPLINPSDSKQRCLIFSYKVMAGNSYGTPSLTVTFGSIPHWATNKGEGRVIIGLFQFNVTSKIIIEGKSCKAAIDNMVIAEGHSCTQQPYQEETDTCLDNCGKISNGHECSCDWKCHSSNNCCPDITTTCPYIKPMEEISRLYLTTTTAIPDKITTAFKNNVSNIDASSSPFPSKILNETKISNEHIIETIPMSEPNIIINNFTTRIITPTFSTLINTTHSTFPFNPLGNTTKKPFTITTMPSTTILTEVTKIKNTSSLNSTLPFKYSPVFTIMSSTKDSINIVNTTTPKIITTTSKVILTPVIINKNSSTNLIYSSNFTTKFLLTNASSTTQASIINSSSTIKHLIVETTNSTTTINNIPSSTNQPIMMNNTIMTAIPINISDITIKPTIVNTLTTKLYNLFTNKTNISNHDDQLNTKFITKLNKTQNEIIADRKPIINNSTSSTPISVDYLNINHIPEKSIVYNTSLNNEPSLHNNSFLSVTNPSINRIESNVWTNIKPLTTELSRQKPELNYSLHNQHKLHLDEFLTEHGKQNEQAKPSYTFDTFTIIKYIAATGVILIIFKYTLCFVRGYFKKPFADDMTTYFIESDNEDICDMELTSNSVK